MVGSQCNHLCKFWWRLVWRWWGQIPPFSIAFHLLLLLQPFYGPLYGLRYQTGKTRKVKPICIYWSKRQWVILASAGPYANMHLVPDTRQVTTPSPFIVVLKTSWSLLWLVRGWMHQQPVNHPLNLTSELFTNLVRLSTVNYVVCWIYTVFHFQCW